SAITIRLYAYKATTSTGAWGPGSSSDGNDLLIYGSQIVLPVKLANFKATQKNTHTDIEWSNLTESEVLNYSVERSPDGRSFEKIITVNVLKNNGSRADYHVTDNEPLAGMNFYRIKALEKTGRIYYTNVIKLDLGSLNTYLDLYPNPTSYGSAISMQLNNLPKGSYVLNIYSIGGQLAHKETFASAGGSLNQQLSVPKLNKGSYFVFVEGAVKLQKKLIIQ
ncbi:MAG TPA: T9SS type A sorting domain-containing protein, partial [Flavisolibacter sp.]|nr:T9SS type A sorting domain-containing protein [Flavisolibacter sp.]